MRICDICGAQSGDEVIYTHFDQNRVLTSPAYWESLIMEKNPDEEMMGGFLTIFTNDKSGFGICDACRKKLENDAELDNEYGVSKFTQSIPSGEVDSYSAGIVAGTVYKKLRGKWPNTIQIGGVPEPSLRFASSDEVVNVADPTVIVGNSESVKIESKSIISQQFSEWQCEKTPEKQHSKYSQTDYGNLVSVEEYSQKQGIKPEQIIEMIKNGELGGCINDKQWFVDTKLSNEMHGPLGSKGLFNWIIEKFHKKKKNQATLEKVKDTAREFGPQLLSRIEDYSENRFSHINKNMLKNLDAGLEKVYEFPENERKPVAMAFLHIFKEEQVDIVRKQVSDELRQYLSNEMVYAEKYKIEELAAELINNAIEEKLENLLVSAKVLYDRKIDEIDSKQPATDGNYTPQDLVKVQISDIDNLVFAILDYVTKQRGLSADQDVDFFSARCDDCSFTFPSKDLSNLATRIRARKMGVKVQTTSGMDVYECPMCKCKTAVVTLIGLTKEELLEVRHYCEHDVITPDKLSLQLLESIYNSAHLKTTPVQGGLSLEIAAQIPCLVKDLSRCIELESGLFIQPGCTKNQISQFLSTINDTGTIKAKLICEGTLIHCVYREYFENGFTKEKIILCTKNFMAIVNNAMKACGAIFRGFSWAEQEKWN